MNESWNDAILGICTGKPQGVGDITRTRTPRYTHTLTRGVGFAVGTSKRHPDLDPSRVHPRVRSKMHYTLLYKMCVVATDP
jgi:hypothetical protein